MTFEAHEGSGDHQTAVKAGISYMYIASADVTKIVQKRSLGTTKEERTFSSGNIRATNTPFKKDLLEDSDRYFRRPKKPDEEVDLGSVWG